MIVTRCIDAPSREEILRHLIGPLKSARSIVGGRLVMLRDELANAA
jgi:hypothetical protein